MFSQINYFIVFLVYISNNTITFYYYYYPGLYILYLNTNTHVFIVSLFKIVKTSFLSFQTQQG